MNQPSDQPIADAAPQPDDDHNPYRPSKVDYVEQGESKATPYPPSIERFWIAFVIATGVNAIAWYLVARIRLEPYRQPPFYIACAPLWIMMSGSIAVTVVLIPYLSTFWKTPISAGHYMHVTGVPLTA